MDSDFDAFDDLLPPEFSEDRLALIFADTHAQNLRYVASWGKWMRWTGTKWEAENTLAVFDMARKICREAAAGCPKDALALAVTKAKTVAAVEILARSDRRIAATVEQWDANPLALNTLAGIVNLKTGAIQPHSRTAYATKITVRGLAGGVLYS